MDICAGERFEQFAYLIKIDRASYILFFSLIRSLRGVRVEMENISTYKQKALPVMTDTIAEFRAMAEEGEKRIRKIEQGAE